MHYKKFAQMAGYAVKVEVDSLQAPVHSTRRTPAILAE